MACSTGCLTQDHLTWGECVRAKSLHTAYMADWKGHDATAQRKADKNLDAYEQARRQGIQPKTTYAADVQHAIQMSDKTGKAYQA